MLQEQRVAFHHEDGTITTTLVPLFADDDDVEDMDEQEMLYVLETRYHPPCRLDPSSSVVPERQRLVHWITELHASWKLVPQTLFLAVHLLDAFFSARSQVVEPGRVSLLAAVCLWVAAKFEESAEDRIDVYAVIAACQPHKMSKRVAAEVELALLQTVQWRLRWPSPLQFLRHPDNRRCWHTVCYLLTLTLPHPPFVKYLPSVLACAAETVAETICNASNQSRTVLRLQVDENDSDPKYVTRRCICELVQLLRAAQTTQSSSTGTPREYYKALGVGTDVRVMVVVVRPTAAAGTPS